MCISSYVGYKFSLHFKYKVMWLCKFLKIVNIHIICNQEMTGGMMERGKMGPAVLFHQRSPVFSKIYFGHSIQRIHFKLR